MTDKSKLPTGQIEADAFERFGLTTYAFHFPENLDDLTFQVGGDVAQKITISDQLAALSRKEQVSDFHCVTTWSVRGVRWGGVSFADFYNQLVLPQAQPKAEVQFVIFTARDGFRSCMLLEDLLAEDVLLADTFEGESLGFEHGAPFRLVAPAHYGYKNIKHISKIEFCLDRKGYKFPPPYPGFMDHLRARVAFEERTKFFPGWLLRLVYRSMIDKTRAKFRKGNTVFYSKQYK